MTAQVRHWPWAVMAFLLTAALLFGGRTLYVRSAQETPFVHAARQVSGVRKVSLAGPKTVNIWLRSGASAADVYSAVASLSQTDLGSTVSIHFMDNPTASERRVGHQVGLMVAEAEAQGNYVSMAQTASSLALAQHERLVWTLGAHNVFVTISHGPHRLILVYPLNWVHAAGNA